MTIYAKALLFCVLLWPASAHAQPLKGSEPRPQPHSYHAIDYGRHGVPALSSAEHRVLNAVLAVTPREKRPSLNFSKYNGALVLFYGSPGDPNGAICEMRESCVTGFLIIGSGNVYFFPRSEGSPEGGHIAVLQDAVVKSPDIVAQKAYAKEHLAVPWSKEWIGKS